MIRPVQFPDPHWIDSPAVNGSLNDLTPFLRQFFRLYIVGTLIKPDFLLKRLHGAIPKSNRPPGRIAESILCPYLYSLIGIAVSLNQEETESSISLSLYICNSTPFTLLWRFRYISSYRFGYAPIVTGFSSPAGFTSTCLGILFTPHA